MAQAQTSASHREFPVSDYLGGRDKNRQESEMNALREENTELRQLVIYLSQLVVKNVLEREH